MVPTRAPPTARYPGSAHGDKHGSRSANLTIRNVFQRLWVSITVFGPATITAASDDDASGVATYCIAGAKLGYPILFALVIITMLLAITQEMGMRLSLITRKGLGDLIRERYGVRASFFTFIPLVIANMGTIVADLAAVKATAGMLNIPALPAVAVILAFTFIFVVRGDYKLTQGIMLVSCLFFLVYIFAAFKSRPHWGLALGNLLYPHGVAFSRQYSIDHLVIGMGVLGTTVTPWGQFFISSFAPDKKIEASKIRYSQFETYWGAFLTDGFSFFMIVATAATLFVHGIPLESGEQAALAIRPFAGELAGTLFALGILNAGFMGIVIVSLSTAYAFAEFFGLSGSLDTSYKQSKTFYVIFIGQLLAAAGIIMLPGTSLFQLAIATQALNAMTLPIVFYYLIGLTNSRALMGKHANHAFQKWFAVASTVVIIVASVGTLAFAIKGF